MFKTTNRTILIAVSALVVIAAAPFLLHLTHHGSHAEHSSHADHNSHATDNSGDSSVDADVDKNVDTNADKNADANAEVAKEATTKHHSHAEQSGQNEEADHSGHAEQSDHKGHTEQAEQADHADHSTHQTKTESSQHTSNTHGSHQHSTTEGSSGKSFYTTFSTASETTFDGLHRIDLIPASPEVPLIEVHHWFVKVFDQWGEEIRPDKLYISGSMPEHGHGLPTRPIVEKYTDTQGYRISNVSFNMAGNWKFNVEFSYQGITDGAEFDIEFPTSESSSTTASTWTEIDKRLLQSLSIHTGRLDKVTRGNDVALDEQAASLGHRLFFDKQLSKNSASSCATCHLPEKYFADGLKTGQGIEQLKRNTPSIVGSVYQNWLYWDGRRDSLWSQALVPLEALDEMGGDRLSIARIVLENYSDEYKNIFGQIPTINFEQLPAHASPVGDEAAQAAWNSLDSSIKTAINTVFANTGKAIAAYETLLTPKAGRFDDFVSVLLETHEPNTEELNEYLDPSEQRGLRLFISNRTQCLNCHASAMFSNFGFHNIGTAQAEDNSIDFGRMLGIESAQLNEFNCNSSFSSSTQNECDLLNSINNQDATQSVRGAFRVPSLRGLNMTAPYMHDGRFASLEDVIRFYVEPQPQLLGKRHDLPAIEKLSDEEVMDLAAFLNSLGNQIDSDSTWLHPPK